MRHSNIVNTMATAILVFIAQGCDAEQSSYSKTSSSDNTTSEESIKENPSSEFADKKSLGDAMSHWVGTYEAQGRACRPEKLKLYKEKKFSWGKGCQEARIQIKSVTETEFLFEIDKNSKCNLGKVVSLLMPKPETRVIFMKSYENMKAFHSNEYRLSCTYSEALK